MPSSAIEIDAFEPEVRTSLHPPFVEILDAERRVFYDALDSGYVPEEGRCSESESKLAQDVYILFD